MKKIFYFMACCLVAGLFWQCNDDDDNNGDKGPLSFKFPLSEATLPQSGGTKLIEFATTEDFTVSVNYDVTPEEGEEWCSVSPLSGNAGRHLMYIELEENPPYDDRYVDIVLTSGGESKTLRITQTNESGILLPQAVYEISADGGEVEIEFETNREVTVSIDSAYMDWIALVDEAPVSKASMETKTVKVKVGPYEGFAGRRGAVTLTEAGGGVSAVATIEQGAVVEEGLWIVEGSTANLTAPSAIRNADGSWEAWYLYKTPTASGEVLAHEVDAHSPYDITTGVFGQKLTMTQAFANLRLLGCTWSQSHGDGKIEVAIYEWNTDYETTVAGAPIATNIVTYADNATFPIFPAETVFAAGTYLVTLTATDNISNHSGLWISNGGPKNGFECFNDGESSDHPVKMFISLSAEKAGAVAARHVVSADGKDWIEKPIATLNNAWIADGVSPEDINVTKVGNYYYAMFSRDADYTVGVARSESADGPWTVWNGRTWAASGSAGAIADAPAASLTSKSGTIYVYTVQGAEVYVATASAASTTWPAALSEGRLAMTLPEDAGNTAVDVKYHADQNVFVATWVVNDQTWAATSTDGLTFGEAELLLPFMRSGAFGLRYATNESGVVTADKWASYGYNGGLYIRPPKK